MLALIPASVRGPAIMMLAVAGLALMNLTVRLMSEELHVLQTTFFRNAFALLFITPWLFSAGLSGLKTTRLRFHVLRSLNGFTAMVIWFLSLSLLPLADATALNFTIPLFVTLGAALFLGESLRLRRSLATLAGFMGVLIIIRPGFAEVSLVTGLPVLAAAFMAGSMLMVKALSRTENPHAMVFYMNLFMTILSIVPALFVWIWPSWEIWLMGAFIGFLGVVCHIGINKAMKLSEASTLAPLDYTRMPVTAGLAFLFFGEFPDLWTWLGAFVIMGSSFYITRREAQLAREGQRNVSCSAESRLRQKPVQ